jgi:light-regulated signal transduction histidine kinase (bacteriophytochrome)
MVMQLRAYTEELEKRVAQRTAQLTEANRDMESFVYSISHDLKTPVVSVHGMASMFLYNYEEKLDEKGHHYIQRILSNAGFMEQLIADLLTFSRLGRQETAPQKLESEEVIQNVLEQCHESIKSREVDVKIHSPLPSVFFDPTHFKQIFLNLVNNGIKFMGEQPHPQIVIGARQLGDRVEFYVKDNGIGIDPKHHDSIFGVFQRLKEVEVDGSGIGLATVKKIVELAGGKIRVESEKGKGATFFFTVPKG